MPVGYFYLAALAILGHAAIAMGVLNRAHGFAGPRPVVKGISLAAFLWLPLGLLAGAVVAAPYVTQETALAQAPKWAVAYLVACWLAAGVAIAGWLWRTARSLGASPLANNHTHILQIDRRLGRRVSENSLGRFCAALPLNESWSLAVQEKTLAIANLPAELEGLSIAHLSDFHFTGCIGRDYFRQVCRAAMDLRCDLMALTGDFIDPARCVSWIPETLGQLSAPLGVYCVMGNHDLRSRAMPALRQALADLSIVDLSGRWLQLDTAAAPIVLCGTAMPWVGPAPPDLDDPSLQSADQPALRLLLSHSPDQIGWARRHNFNLMLAGHTHGGQVRLPLVGPVLCPSKFGVHYASGVFHEPPTVLHVTRGVSGETPLRWNCRPEIAKLILRRPTNQRR